MRMGYPEEIDSFMCKNIRTKNYTMHKSGVKLEVHITIHFICAELRGRIAKCWPLHKPIVIADSKMYPIIPFPHALLV